MITLNDFEISPFGRPNTPGVYAVWASNMNYEGGVPHLLYIGSSKKIGSRLNNPNHPYKIAYRKLNGLVYVSFLETSDYIKIEKELIARHKPKLNIQWR